ncbi:MAG: PIN domain nuclease [Candidatus Schekmanbacteria bacterium]|nr:PIN domain nuclease [Candidatus Schekmanbacteria bacterium]
MKTKILVDTSAWICSFKKEGFEKIKEQIISALDENLIVTSGLIVLELLQGAINQKEYVNLQSYLEALHFLPTDDDIWFKAAQLAFSLKRKGITVPATDILISALSIEHNCLLLHYDKHFDLIARHSDLKILTLNYNER